MPKLTYALPSNGSVNRWWISPQYWRPYESPAKTFDAPVNLEENYVQIVYPIRESFLSSNNLANILYHPGPWETIYFPFENNKVEFSTFCHTPRHLWIYAKTILEVPQAGTYPFDVYTCGGLKIWINGEHAHTYAPYTRNIAGCIRLEFNLKAGDNEILVYADELAERDVFFYFELRYKGDHGLRGTLPIEGDPEEILEVESFLQKCYFERDSFQEGDLLLHYDKNTLHKPRTVSLEYESDLSKSEHPEDPPTSGIIARADRNMVSFGPIDSYKIGMFRVQIVCKAGGFSIKRALMLGILPKKKTSFIAGSTLAERKKQALNFIVHHGEMVVNRTLVLLETRRHLDDLGAQCLNTSLEMIRNKADCADFYLAPLLLLMKRYPDLLDSDLLSQLKQHVLAFRYWIDEPGNDVMWYFSENHAFLFHTSQYLGGSFFPDETFVVSQRTGSEQMAIGKRRLEEWFRIFFQNGFAEWNSATYIPIDLIGFFVLYEIAPDESIREMARKALDFTFKIIKYNSFNGVMSSSYGRAYENTLKAREQVETTFIEWVAWGTGQVNERSRAVSLFCLSSYEPPAYHTETSLAPGEWMEVELDQGISRVKTYNFRTHDYSLACVRRFRPFVHGHQQHLMNLALGKNATQFYLNHPGERPFSGENRPSYWAGNGTNPLIEQYRNVQLIRYSINPEDLVHYIHAYCPLYSFDEYRIHGNWFFAKKDQGFFGCWFSNGFAITESGANTRKEIISQGLQHWILLKAGNDTQWSDFNTFVDNFHKISPQHSHDHLEYSDPEFGTVQMVGIDSLIISGIKQSYNKTDTMRVTRGMQ